MLTHVLNRFRSHLLIATLTSALVVFSQPQAHPTPQVDVSCSTDICAGRSSDDSSATGSTLSTGFAKPLEVCTTGQTEDCIIEYTIELDHSKPLAEQAWSVLAQLHIPRPALNIVPEPSANEWNMIVVGHPLWFWTTEPATAFTHAESGGHHFTLSAIRNHTTINTGDGTTLTCSTMTPYGPHIEPGTPSPDCGHTYLRAGSITITATTQWTVAWQSEGQTGSIPVRLTAARPTEIGELHSLLIKR